MPELNFSIPYNNDFETLEKIVQLNRGGKNRIEGIYLSAPQDIFGSGRDVKKINPDHIRKVIKFCKKYSYKVDLAFNSTCEGLDWYNVTFISRTLNFIKKMRKIGVNGAIFSNPLYIQKTKKEFKDMEIIASAFCCIDSLEKAKYYENLGATTIVPNDINRDFNMLKKIKEGTNLKIRLMVNEGCLWKCPYRIVHNNYTSHLSRSSEDFIDFASEICIRERARNPSTILKSGWIRPEDLKKYKKITDYFKIVGRTMPNEWIKDVVRFYLNEKYDGNLLDILAGPIPKYLEIKDTIIDNRSLDDFLNKIINLRNEGKHDFYEKMVNRVIKFPNKN